MPATAPVTAAAALVAALALQACSLAPDYQVPKAVPAPETFKEAGDWMPAQPADAASRGHWWETFNDPVLSSLELQLVDANQNLRAAVARYQQAKAAVQRAQSDLYPTLDARSSATRERFSSNSPTHIQLPPAIAEQINSKSVNDDYLASLSLSWEIDLFGRLRNAEAAADADFQATAGDLASLNLSLQAELAQDYFGLRATEADQRLLTDTVDAYQKALELTQRRYDGGIADAADVDQAQTQLASAQAQLAATALGRAQLEHAIAVLVGQSPSTFALAQGDFVGEPPALTLALPSTLLQRRPDIASAERRVAAANDQIGVARAAWFPVFTFGATGGYESKAGHSWFDAPSRLWSIGPGVSLPVLDGGARSAINAQARAAYNEAVANYRQSVLGAYQEVEDALASLHHLADEVTSNDAAAEAADRFLFHANKRYSSGVADYLQVTTAQAASLSSRRAAIDARRQRLQAAVQLVRALGGDWTPQQIDNAAVPVAQTADPVP